MMRDDALMRRGGGARGGSPRRTTKRRPAIHRVTRTTERPTDTSVSRSTFFERVRRAATRKERDVRIAPTRTSVDFCPDFKLTVTTW
jgi:hypothetical protein